MIFRFGRGLLRSGGVLGLGKLLADRGLAADLDLERGRTVLLPALAGGGQQAPQGVLALWLIVPAHHLAMLRHLPVDAMIILLIGTAGFGSILKFQADLLNGKRLLPQLGGVLAVVQLIEIAEPYSTPLRYFLAFLPFM